MVKRGKTMNLNGYQTFTTFWQDFSIADEFGVCAIRDTYKRAFNEWKNNYKYLTELVMVLNYKSWQHYEEGNRFFSEVYTKLYEEANGYAYESLKGEELDYYFSITD